MGKHTERCTYASHFPEKQHGVPSTVKQLCKVSGYKWNIIFTGTSPSNPANSALASSKWRVCTETHSMDMCRKTYVHTKPSE